MPVEISLDPNGEGFILTFPPLPGNSRSHHSFLPATLIGLVALRRILRARAREEERCGIGTEGAPTSYQIEVICAALQSSKSCVTEAASDFLRAKQRAEREERRIAPKGPSNKIKKGRAAAFDIAALELEL